MHNNSAHSCLLYILESDRFGHYDIGIGQLGSDPWYFYSATYSPCGNHGIYVASSAKLPQGNQHATGDVRACNPSGTVFGMTLTFMV